MTPKQSALLVHAFSQLWIILRRTGSVLSTDRLLVTVPEGQSGTLHRVLQFPLLAQAVQTSGQGTPARQGPGPNLGATGLTQPGQSCLYGVLSPVVTRQDSVFQFCEDTAVCRVWLLQTIAWMDAPGNRGRTVLGMDSGLGDSGKQHAVTRFCSHPL